MRARDCEGFHEKRAYAKMHGMAWHGIMSEHVRSTSISSNAGRKKENKFKAYTESD